MNYFRNRLNRLWRYFPADYLQEPDDTELALLQVLKRWEMVRGESGVPRTEFPTAEQLYADTDDGHVVPRSTWLTIPADDPRLDAFVIDRHTLLGMGSLRQVVVFLNLPTGR